MNKTEAVYIVATLRTPVGRLYGSLAQIRPDDLVAGLLSALLKKYDFLNVNDLDALYLGCGNQAGEDNRNIARQALLLNGLPHQVYASTVNSLCTSGMDAVMQAARMIACGEANFCIAGGVDSMSRSPWVESRTDGHREDSTVGWRFVNPKIYEKIEPHSMPETAELLSIKLSISREMQDRHAFESRKRYEKACQDAFYASHLVDVDWPQGKLSLNRDEQHRLLNLDLLGQLPPLVKGGKFVTLGNSARLGDGAALLALASETYIQQHQIRPLARIHSMATAAEHPDDMAIAGATALKKALDRGGLKAKDLEMVEFSEAFAVQVLACMRALDLSPDVVNPYGGSISIGNPLGMGAARLLCTAVAALEKDSTCRYAAAAGGAGLGVGTAMVLERSI